MGKGWERGTGWMVWGGGGGMGWRKCEGERTL